MSFQRFSSSNLSRFSGLCVFVTVYVSLFAIAGVILYGSLFKIRKNNVIISDHPHSLHKVELSSHYQRGSSFPLLNFLDQWQNKVLENKSKYIFDRQSTDLFPRFLIDLYGSRSFPGVINCSSLHEVTDLEFVAVGWTKVVYKGRYHGKSVAVKMVNYHGQDIQECLKLPGTTLTMCYQRAEAKMLKEIILLTELAHKNVVKVLGFCIPETIGSVTLVTELGEPLDTVRLLQISWEDRLHLILGVAHILHHLAYSPLGSLSMNDFRRQQFVVVNGTLKLTDVDDIGIGEPKCTSNEICKRLADHFGAGDSSTRAPPCHNFHCIGHNSLLNIWHAGQHFVKLLLPISAPDSLKPHIEDLLAVYEFKRKPVSTSDVSHIVEATHHLVNLYTSGVYLNLNGGSIKPGFKKFDGDLPGMFDYSCRHSISAVSCVRSVFNEEEAAQFCAQDIDCKVVVLSQQRTWTGRTIAIFKNGFDYPVRKEGFILLLKDDVK